MGKNVSSFKFPVSSKAISRQPSAIRKNVSRFKFPVSSKAISRQRSAIRKAEGKSKDVERIAQMKSRLRKGEIAEALFVAKVLSLGMNVSKPFGQNCRYDFMVEVMGRATRVQVKSTWQKKGLQPSAIRKNVSRFAFHVSRKSRQPSAVSRQGTGRPRIGTDKHGSEQYVVRAGGTTTRGARRYRASEVDYIAAYVGPENEWYVIPVRRIPSAFTIVLPGRYARYREAWELLCPKSVVLSEIKAAADPNCGEWVLREALRISAAGPNAPVSRQPSAIRKNVSSFKFPVSSKAVSRQPSAISHQEERFEFQVSSFERSHQPSTISPQPSGRAFRAVRIHPLGRYSSHCR